MRARTPRWHGQEGGGVWRSRGSRPGWGRMCGAGGQLSDDAGCKQRATRRKRPSKRAGQLSMTGRARRTTSRAAAQACRLVPSRRPALGQRAGVLAAVAAPASAALGQGWPRPPSAPLSPPHPPCRSAGRKGGHRPRRLIQIPRHRRSPSTRVATPGHQAGRPGCMAGTLPTSPAHQRGLAAAASGPLTSAFAFSALAARSAAAFSTSTTFCLSHTAGQSASLGTQLQGRSRVGGS